MDLWSYTLLLDAIGKSTKKLMKSSSISHPLLFFALLLDPKVGIKKVCLELFVP